MNRALRKWVDIFEGNEVMSNRSKYSVISIGLLTVHACLLVFFAYVNILPMVVLNVISILVYLYSLYAVRKGNLFQDFILSYSEILLHSVISIALLGIDSAFAFFNITIIPVSFYVCYTTDKVRHKLLLPLTLTVANITLTFLADLHDFYHGPSYTNITEGEIFLLQMFVGIVSFFFVTCFAFFFVVEIRQTHRLMEKQNAVLDMLANYDPLTGLLNRRTMEGHFQEAIKQAREHGKPFCIALCDIDDFKNVNDTYGHDCGDRVLMHIANLVQDNLEEGDYICRWGGEEFLLLMNSSFSRSYSKVEVTRMVIENTAFYYEGERITFTVTFGIEPYQEGMKVEKIIQQADIKLYEGKSRGKNQVVT